MVWRWTGKADDHPWLIRRAGGESKKEKKKKKKGTPGRGSGSRTTDIKPAQLSLLSASLFQPGFFPSPFQFLTSLFFFIYSLFVFFFSLSIVVVRLLILISPIPLRSVSYPVSSLPLLPRSSR
ncbi:hypothetical protein ASPBRDRAFT_239803 [Aspergillus brasiliensis CBS 101740]|uniref:Uncharacterized protein n=1 Tax=Aspergillus brasiliensis (strain CBS 101740 / IMI 381727 / IBT 21946) TaxID=767769 RepID=A0A1L9V0N9_ASPBC|nr:hypothetical protein ASPBRDRAFT_239803 [Aspergillus brasiliensis CBS 101740]